MKKVLILIDNIQRARFFYKLQAGVKSAGFNEEIEITYITGKLSCYRFIKKLGGKVELICSRWTRARKDTSKDALSTLEYLRCDIKKSQAIAIYTSAQEMAQRIVSFYDILILWNGNQIIESAFSKVFKKERKKTVFLEIGNFPNKTFVDNQGVNAASKIAQNPGALDQEKYNVSDSDFREWLKDYHLKKREVKTIPQSLDATKIPHERILDYLAYRVGFGLYAISFTQILKKIKNKKRCKKYIDDNIDVRKTTPEKFVFLPMQVSSDTQLLINSDIDNLGAIEVSRKIANERGVPLVIKLHPSENSITFYKSLKTVLANNPEIKISDNTTIDLIKKSIAVVTINSTVGIEALLEDKEVIVLGRSHYTTFVGRRDRLRNYICSYLYDIDYFTNESVDGKVLIRFWKDVVQT